MHVCIHAALVDSHGHGEEEEQAEGGGEGLRSPGMTKTAGGSLQLRRANYTASGHDWEGDQRGKREESTGYIAMGSEH